MSEVTQISEALKVLKGNRRELVLETIHADHLEDGMLERIAVLHQAIAAMQAVMDAEK